MVGHSGLAEPLEFQVERRSGPQPDYGTISLPQLQAITSTSKGRILSNPTIITRSGEKGHLFVGGEIPIRLIVPIGAHCGRGLLYRAANIEAGLACRQRNRSALAEVHYKPFDTAARIAP